MDLTTLPTISSSFLRNDYLPGYWNVEFQVIGMPASQGSKRFVGVNKQGHGIMVEQSTKLKPWREAVKWAAPIHAIQGILNGPIEAQITFTWPKPKSAPKRRVTYPDRTPDLDKLLRSTLDAIVQAGLIEDDARVITCLARKVFPGEDADSLPVPGAIIRLRKVIP